MASHEARLGELIRRSDLQPFEDRLRQLARPAIDILPVLDQAQPPPGASRVGGVPDVPPGFEWPHLGAIRLSSVVQIRMSDLPAGPASELLPSAGLLSLFVAQDPDGEAFSGDAGYARAFLFPEGVLLAPAERPGPAASSRACGLEFAATSDVPFDAFQWRALQAGEECPIDDSQLWQLHQDLHQSSHYLLGHPSHCTLAYDPTPGPEWVALFSLGTDDDLGWCWGDGDRLMTFIERRALAAGLFDRLEAAEG